MKNKAVEETHELIRELIRKVLTEMIERQPNIDEMTLHELLKEYERDLKLMGIDYGEIDRRLKLLNYYFEEDLLSDKDFNRDDYMIVNRYDYP